MEQGNQILTHVLIAFKEGEIKRKKMWDLVKVSLCHPYSSFFSSTCEDYDHVSNHHLILEKKNDLLKVDEVQIR
jgi:hypothetical protein